MKNGLSNSTQKRMVSGAAAGGSQESASSRRALGLAPGPRGGGGRMGILRQAAGEPKGRWRRIAEWRSVAVWAAVALAGAAARGEVVDRHRVAEWRFAVTNGTEAVQTVEGVRVSCPCLKAEDNEKLEREGSSARSASAPCRADATKCVPPKRRLGSAALPFRAPALNPMGRRVSPRAAEVRFSGNRDFNLTYFLSNSVNSMSLIYNKPLPLVFRCATVCGRGVNGHV